MLAGAHIFRDRGLRTNNGAGAKRDVSFDLFSGAGGSRFRPGVTRIKSVRITAKDVAGRSYKVEAPFN